MMGSLRQAMAALRVSADSLSTRPRHAFLVATGFLIASFTLLAVLTIPAGLQQLVGRTGSDRIAVVLADRGWDETSGSIAPELVDRIAALPGVAKRADGLPLIAPQFVVTRKLGRRDGTIGTVLVRGVSPATWDIVEPLVQLAGGTPPAPGTMELAAGRLLPATYPFTDSGSELRLVPGSLAAWRVSGTFSAQGGLWESELWADLDNLRGAFNADGQTTTVWVLVDSTEAFSRFESAMQADPRLRGFRVVSQSALYGMRVAFLSHFTRVGAAAVAVVLGMMAVLAGASAAGLMLRARRRELATLRAIGFSRNALLIAIVFEMLFLASVSVVISVVLAFLLLPSHEIQSSSGLLSVGFAPAITRDVVALTLSYALLLALLAALVPAWRILDAPLATALAKE